MKIVHVSLNGPFTDRWQYQDNLLPKYHKIAGNEVTIITSLFMYDNQGKLSLDTRSEYYNEDEIKVIRLKTLRDKSIHYKFKRYTGLFESIELEEPELLFVHGVQFLDIRIIVKYVKKYFHCKLLIDNHADFSNSATNWLSKNILHKILWRHCAKMVEPFTTKFFGVLPARVDFLRSVYKLPEKKLDLLVMGADDELVRNVLSFRENNLIKNHHNIKDKDFIIVTGGKVDDAKSQTLLLMEAINRLETENIKLIVFGSISKSLRIEFDRLLSSDHIFYEGWLTPEDCMKYFASANLVVFPGRHSVFWEQVVPLGVPMLVKYWEGTTHIDIGGNCLYLYDDSIEEITEKLLDIVFVPKKYELLKQNSLKTERSNFLYSKIAAKSLESL